MSEADTSDSVPAALSATTHLEACTGFLDERPLLFAVTRSVVLFAKALTASDCCTSISKGGRITIPRVAVESNLPSVADKKHHEVVFLFAKQDLAASQACVTLVFPY